MSRPLRIEFPDALYHVTARGNERKRIVRDDEDRLLWLGVLDRTVRRFDWKCHAFCLMRNHFHLLVQTPRANLARGMRELNGVYAQAFNGRHRRVGHLFGGRYCAVLVERETHLLSTARYIVLNPERVDDGAIRVDRYRWSSYRATVGLDTTPELLTTDWILGQFARNREQARRRYRAYVYAGRDTDAPPVRAQIYRGSDRFVRVHQPYSVDDPEIRREQREPVAASLEAVLATGSNEALIRAYYDHEFRIREIAAAMGVHYSTVSRRLRAAESDHTEKSPRVLQCKT